MAIPTYDEFIGPLLSFLSTQTEPIRAGQAHEAVAQRVGLAPEEMSELLPSKVQHVYKNRIGWAHDALKRAKLSSSPRRGMWLLTDDGRGLAERHPSGLPADEANRIANLDRHTRIKSILGGEEHEVAVQEIAAVETKSPEEEIESGLGALRTRVARDLLEIIGRSSPAFFERMVLDVLHAMGYGKSEDDVQQVGKSGDGGIDGIISLDRLGLEKVYVQAKRWQGNVGSPQIQSFMGALQLQGARKGVLITSGVISKPAWDAARHARGSVVLIDGARLADLMIEHGVGVSHELVRVPQVDSDYFEEED